MSEAVALAANQRARPYMTTAYGRVIAVALLFVLLYWVTFELLATAASLKVPAASGTPPLFLEVALMGPLRSRIAGVTTAIGAYLIPRWVLWPVQRPRILLRKVKGAWAL